MSHDLLKLMSGEVVEEEVELTLGELCRACDLTAEKVLELIEYGVIEPQGRRPSQWRFRGVSLRRVRRARRLQQDLGVNIAGVALALDLLDELERLQRRLHRLER